MLHISVSKPALIRRFFISGISSFLKDSRHKHCPYVRNKKGANAMETRIALIGIIIDNPDSVEKVNAALHEYAQAIIGRMGIPYREKGLNIISVALDADNNTISSLAGKLGMLPGVHAKTLYSK